MAALTDYEEMVLALVHPLVQFLSSLLVMPRDMPFVQVRSRKLKGHPGGKSLLKVDVHKLRAAFSWLRMITTRGRLRPLVATGLLPRPHAAVHEPLASLAGGPAEEQLRTPSMHACE